MGNMQDAIKQAAQKAQEEQHQKLLEDISGVYKGMYDSATNYVNIIMAGGYAGAFAIWSLSGDALDTVQRSWAGLWLFISLAVFVLWEVAKMILLGVAAIRFQSLHASKPGELPHLIEKHRKAENKLVNKFHFVWAVFVLPGAIIPALLGSGVLVHAFLTKLF